MHSTDYYEIIPETVGRLLGLKDKQGNDVWEGDILAVMLSNGNAIYRQVVFDSERLGWGLLEVTGLIFPTPTAITSKWWTEFGGSIEVAGNIHQQNQHNHGN